MYGARAGSDREGAELRSWLRRVRWRRRGAWLWPTFVAFTVLDALIGHELPPQGETQTWIAAALLGGVLNLLVVILLSRPLASALRRVRPDLPKVVARDYVGRATIVAVSVALAAVGLAHHPAIVRQDQAMRDAIVRAQAFIGDRAPAEFRRNVRFVDTFTIEPGRLYRTCVPSADRRRNYCVIVDAKLPLARSVRFAGYESNAVFAAGTG